MSSIGKHLSSKNEEQNNKWQARNNAFICKASWDHRVWRSTRHTLHKSAWEADQKRLRDPQERSLHPTVSLTSIDNP